MDRKGEEGRAVRRRRYDQVRIVNSQRVARQVVADASTIALIDRSGLRSAVFQCPCTCADVLVINLDASFSSPWRVRLAHGLLTLMPSIWRTSGCKSHFILWRNEVWWCGIGDVNDQDGANELWPTEMDDELKLEWQRLRRQSRSQSRGRGTCRPAARGAHCSTYCPTRSA